MAEVAPRVEHASVWVVPRSSPASDLPELSLLSLGLASAGPAPVLCPSPALPWEVFEGIIHQSDQSTLAAFLLVSREVLELVAPLLYRGVIVRGTGRLEKLLSSRGLTAPGTPPATTALSPFFDLNQIKTFTLIVHHVNEIEDALWLDLYPLRPILPSVPDLVVHLALDTGDTLPANSIQTAWWIRPFLTLFNPLQCTLSVAPSFAHVVPRFGLLHEWTRLVLLSHVHTSPWHRSLDTALNIPSATASIGSIEIQHDLRPAFPISGPCSEAQERYITRLLTDLLGLTNGFGPMRIHSPVALLESSVVAKIVLRVADRSQAERTWARIRQAWHDAGSKAADRARHLKWASKVVFCLDEGEEEKEQRLMVVPREHGARDRGYVAWKLVSSGSTMS